MGGIVGGVLGFAGKNRSSGDRAATSSQNASIAVSRENLEFQREQYDRWVSIYGDLQENLGKYYETLGPERIISFGLQAQQREYQKAKIDINKNLARRGLSDSKFADYTRSNLRLSNAQSRAQIRATAPDVVRQQQQNWLGIGLGQQIQLLNTNANSANALAQGYTNRASFYQNEAQWQKQQWDDAMSTAGTAVTLLTAGLGG